MSSSRSAALLCAVDDIPLAFLTDGRASPLIFLGLLFLRLPAWVAFLVRHPCHSQFQR